MTYNAGQVKAIYPYLPRKPKWFLLGGPADGDEAQCMVEKFPGINVLAVEPVEMFRQWQFANGFNGVMIHGALSDKRGVGSIRVEAGQERTATMVLDRGGTETKVITCVLDKLSIQYGPFTDAVLWLDIEGMEYFALLGARRLLSSGAVMLVNVEVRKDEATTVGQLIEELLTDYGFEMVKKWGDGGIALNWIYVLQE